MPHLRSFAVLLLLAGLASADPQPASPIAVANYTAGETIRHPVALITGHLADKSLTHVTLTNASSKRDTATMKGQALGGQFKVLADLVPGENKLTLAAGDANIPFAIHYKPQTNPHFVRIIYMTDSTGDTAYQSQLADDKQEYRGKLDTAMKLMQTMTAERMHDLGYGRRTFNIELDDEGKVKVHLHKGAKPADEYYKLDDQAWYREVSREMNAAFDMKHAKNIVIAAYTRFDPVTKKTLGHTALGGGNQGLFGGGNIFTWPSSLHEVQPAFMNSTRMDNTKVQDDSAGRNTFWGAASTTIGATLHEMGHAFGLPHTRVPTDIMTRGFDRFNRVFCVAEPARRANQPPRSFDADEVAEFAPISAQSLLTSRWFALDEREYKERGDISIRYNAEDESILVTSPAGIRFVAVHHKGDAVFHKAPAISEPAFAEFRISLADIRKQIGETDLMIRAVNTEGHVAQSSIDRLVQRGDKKGG